MWVLIIAIILLIVSLIYVIISDEADGPSYIAGAWTSLLFMIALANHVKEREYKQGQIDALNGKYKYKQLIQYEFIDNTYIPVDTIYVEIK